MHSPSYMHSLLHCHALPWGPHMPLPARALGRVSACMHFCLTMHLLALTPPHGCAQPWASPHACLPSSSLAITLPCAWWAPHALTGLIKVEGPPAAESAGAGSDRGGSAAGGQGAEGGGASATGLCEALQGAWQARRCRRGKEGEDEDGRSGKLLDGAGGWGAGAGAGARALLLHGAVGSGSGSSTTSSLGSGGMEGSGGGGSSSRSLSSSGGSSGGTAGAGRHTADRALRPSSGSAVHLRDAGQPLPGVYIQASVHHSGSNGGASAVPPALLYAAGPGNGLGAVQLPLHVLPRADSPATAAAAAGGAAAERQLHGRRARSAHKPPTGPQPPPLPPRHRSVGGAPMDGAARAQQQKQQQQPQMPAGGHLCPSPRPTSSPLTSLHCSHSSGSGDCAAGGQGPASSLGPRSCAGKPGGSHCKEGGPGACAGKGGAEGAAGQSGGGPAGDGKDTDGSGPPVAMSRSPAPKVPRVASLTTRKNQALGAQHERSLHVCVCVCVCTRVHVCLQADW